jgi:hypothetical protein
MHVVSVNKSTKVIEYYEPNACLELSYIPVALGISNRTYTN